MSDRLLGLLLFLPVPFVLFLFTQTPFGAGISLGLGILLVLTHRLYARPFALGRRKRRCLWCGGPAGGGARIVVSEPGGASSWRTCRKEHAERLRRVLAFAGRHRAFLRFGILFTLASYFALAAASALGMGRGLLEGDRRAFFRLGVALTVLPLGWLGSASDPQDEAPALLPFPVHIQSLIGTCAVLWLFRLVGTAWLVLGVIHVARRMGLHGP